jgi:hypothetical protein
VAESGTRGLGTPVVEEEHVTAVEEESGSTRGLAAVQRTESGKRCLRALIKEEELVAAAGGAGVAGHVWAGVGSGRRARKGVGGRQDGQGRADGDASVDG